jgi:hypothetical protein
MMADFVSQYPSEAIVVLSRLQQWGYIDANDMASGPQNTLDNVVRSFLAAGQGYTGCNVSINADTRGVTVGTAGSAPDMLFNLGGGYPLRAPFNVDLTGFINAIPDTTTSQRIVIVASGGTGSVTESRTLEDASLKPANPQDLWPTVQEVITTRSVRAMVVDRVPGTLAISPSDPDVNPLLCKLATVVIDKTGVISVTQNTDLQITTLAQMAVLLKSVSDQAAGFKSAIDGLNSGLAALTASDKQMYADIQSEIAALTARLNAIQTNQQTVTDGSTLTINEFFNDASGLTAGGAFSVGSGLGFPTSIANPSQFYPINPNSSKIKIMGGRYLMPAFFTSPWGPYSAGNEPKLAANTCPVWNTALKKKGFGVQRTRYGAGYVAQSTTQVQASGDPTLLFGINPGDLVYQNTWYDWRETQPELNHSNGFWKDLTSRGYWTPVADDGAITGKNAFSQVYRNSYDAMITSFNIDVYRGTRGDIRLLVCEELNGGPDPSTVLMDITVPYANLVNGNAANSFDFPYPLLLKGSTDYHFVVLTDGDHLFGTTGYTPYSGNSNVNMFGPVLALTQAGNWQGIQTGSTVHVMACRVIYASFGTSTGPLELNLLYLGGGIENLDFLVPAIVPDGCDIIYGITLQGQAAYTRLGPIDPANPQSNLIASRPSGIRPFVELNVTTYTAPIIDLQASVSGAAATQASRLATDLRAESAPRNPLDANGNAKPVTTVKRKVFLVGFDPNFHTYQEEVEYGASYGTLLPAGSFTGPTAQSDGTWLYQATFTMPTPQSTFKDLMLGHTSDSTHQFNVKQAITTAA